MPTLYTVIRRPLITEKGLGVKETEGTLVFEVAPNATKTEVKQAVEALFKVKVAAVRTANCCGQGAPPRQVRRLSPGLEEGLCPPEGRREDAGVREQPVRRIELECSWSVAQNGLSEPEVELRRNGESGAEVRRRSSRTKDDGDQDIQTDNADAALQDLAGQ